MQPGEKIHKVKPSAKAVGQVMLAVKNSSNNTGPTMKQIYNYISEALYKPATKRQVQNALKRGVEFGILTCKRGHYMISPEESDSNGELMMPTMLQSPMSNRSSKLASQRRVYGTKPRRMIYSRPRTLARNELMRAESRSRRPATSESADQDSTEDLDCA